MLGITLKQFTGALGGSVMVLGVATSTLSGGTALASNDTHTTPTFAEQREKGHDRLADVLNMLVQKGVITAQQKDAILDALKHAHGGRDHDRDNRRRFLGNVLEESVQYLGVPADQVKDQLAAGKSLGEIANQTTGKSRDGLVNYLDDAAAKRIKEAVDDKKITPDQAEKIRTSVDAMIVKIVDHEGTPKKST